jgi:hypothetical protein
MFSTLKVMVDSLLTGLGLFLAAGGALAVLGGLGIHILYMIRGAPQKGHFHTLPYTDIADAMAAGDKDIALVKIHGSVQATNRGTVLTPLSQSHAVWYRTQCFNITDDGRLMSEQTSPLPFFLQDASASVLMHPTSQIIGLAQQKRRVTEDPIRDLKRITHELNPQLQAVESSLASGQPLVVIGAITRQGEQYFLDTRGADALVIAGSKDTAEGHMESSEKTWNRWGSRMVTEGGAACIIGLLLWSLVVG